MGESQERLRLSRARRRGDRSRVVTSWGRRCKTRRQKIIYIVVVVAILLYPSRRRQWLVKLPLWGKFVEYFSTEVRTTARRLQQTCASGRKLEPLRLMSANCMCTDQVIADDPIPERPAMFAVIPHGTFPFGLGVVRRLSTLSCSRVP